MLPGHIAFAIIFCFLARLLLTKRIALLHSRFCSYDILSDDGADSKPVKYARIGDQVYHKWTCYTSAPSTPDNVYCMRVHSCSVNDGQGGEPFYVLDSNG